MTERDAEEAGEGNRGIGFHSTYSRATRKCGEMRVLRIPRQVTVSLCLS